MIIDDYMLINKVNSGASSVEKYKVYKDGKYYLGGEKMKELKKYEGNRVILMACSKCNVACKHCYIGYTGNRTPEELEQLAKYYSEKFKIVRIDGAEPLTDLGYLRSYKIVG